MPPVASHHSEYLTVERSAIPIERAASSKLRSNAHTIFGAGVVIVGSKQPSPCSSHLQGSSGPTDHQAVFAIAILSRKRKEPEQEGTKYTTLHQSDMNLYSTCSWQLCRESLVLELDCRRTNAQRNVPGICPSCDFCDILRHFVTPLRRIARTAYANARPRIGSQPNQRSYPVGECQSDFFCVGQLDRVLEPWKYAELPVNNTMHITLRHNRTVEPASSVFNGNAMVRRE
jgi:hypothetical protein